MNKLKTFFAHHQIQIALALGIGIIAQAYFYKRVYQIEVKGLFLAVPGLIASLYEALIHDKKKRAKKWPKPGYWVLAITVANIISILIPLFQNKPESV